MLRWFIVIFIASAHVTNADEYSTCPEAKNYECQIEHLSPLMGTKWRCVFELESKSNIVCRLTARFQNTRDNENSPWLLVTICFGTASIVFVGGFIFSYLLQVLKEKRRHLDDNDALLCPDISLMPHPEQWQEQREQDNTNRHSKPCSQYKSNSDAQYSKPVKIDRSRHIEGSNVEEPANSKEPAASNESAVSKEPTASKEPAAGKEPAATKETATSKEPAAGKEPAAIKMPAVSKEVEDGDDNKELNYVRIEFDNARSYEVNVRQEESKYSEILWQNPNTPEEHNVDQSYCDLK